MKESIKWLLQKIFLFSKKNLFKTIFLLLTMSLSCSLYVNHSNSQNNLVLNSQSNYIDKKLVGIESTTIDHRVVDINLNSWLKDGIINASELNGYQKIKSDSFYLYGENINEIHLPDSMTTIGIGAFQSARTSIKKFFIPKSVIDLQGNIFIDTEPKELIFEQGSKYSIENGCVYENSQNKLLFVLPNAIKGQTIRIKPSTRIIAPYAFSNLYGAGTHKPFDIVQSDFNNIVEIQEYAFFQANLKSFEIGNNIKKIGAGAFGGFVGLLSSTNDNYVIENKNKYDILVDIKNDTAMSLINPRWANKEKVEISLNYQYIGNSFYAIFGPLYTDILTFGPKVKEIGDYAFDNTNLSEIVFLGNNLTKVGNLAFSNTNSQYEEKRKFIIKFPDGLKYIGEGVFWNSGDGIVKIPSTVEFIGTGININAPKVNIDLDVNNKNYRMSNGLLIENRTSSVISYDNDWLLDPVNKGKFIVDSDIKYIQPRSLTLLLSNPNFKGIEIKNPNIIIGNGAFLNSGNGPGGTKIDMIVPESMPLETKRYIITPIMSWEFGSFQDTNLTKYGGGSWNGTINGQSDFVPIPKPEPFPPPAENNTTIGVNVPPRFYLFLPTGLKNVSFEVFEQWFTIMNASKEPPTTIKIKEIRTNNLEGKLQLVIEVRNAIISNELSQKPIIQTIDIDGFKKSQMTSLVQTNIPNPKIDVPSLSELSTFIDYADTGDIINHDFYKYNNGGGATKIKTSFVIESILNKKTSLGYLDDYYDDKLHIRVRVDNYYNINGDFVEETFNNYKPLYLEMKLDGFNLIKIKNKEYNGNDIKLWIILLIIGLIVLAMIIAIILMTWKRKKIK